MHLLHKSSVPRVFSWNCHFARSGTSSCSSELKDVKTLIFSADGSWCFSQNTSMCLHFIHAWCNANDKFCPELILNFPLNRTYVITVSRHKNMHTTNNCKPFPLPSFPVVCWTCLTFRKGQIEKSSLGRKMTN